MISNQLTEADRNMLLTEGAYLGSFLSFITEDELNKLKNIVSSIHKYTVESRGELMYRFNSTKVKVADITDSDFDSIKTKNRGQISQSFYEFNINNSIFIEIQKRILKFFYPDVIVSPDSVPQFMLYEDGQLIEPHKDGGKDQNPNRVCVIILYLTDEADYNDGGGEFVVTTNSGNTQEIKPVFGTFSILDFTNSNVVHSVKPVRNGFKRLSSICFFNSYEIHNKEGHQHD